MQIIFFLGVSPGLTILLPRSVLSADIQDPNDILPTFNIAIAIYLGKCVPTVGCARTQNLFA